MKKIYHDNQNESTLLIVSTIKIIILKRHSALLKRKERLQKKVRRR
jgi:hypothetical protein